MHCSYAVVRAIERSNERSRGRTFGQRSQGPRNGTHGLCLSACLSVGRSGCPSVKRSVSLGGWASVDVRVRECALEGFVRVPKLACNGVIFGKIRRLQTHANERIYDLVLQTIAVHLVLCVRVLGREVVWVCAKSLFRLASVMTL